MWRWLTALEAAFRFGQPEIRSSDQGSQFTSPDFLAPQKKRGISISMDGRSRALNDVFIERLWRSLKYELIDPGDFGRGADLFHALDRYFHFRTVLCRIAHLKSTNFTLAAYFVFKSHFRARRHC
jgi:putative transposase